MKKTYEDFLKIRDALNELKGVEENFPLKAALKLIKSKNEINNVLAPYDQMQRVLFEKYADGQGTMTRTEENAEKFDALVREYSDLLKEELDVDIQTIPSAELDDLKLPFKVIDAIEFMIED